MEIIAVAAPDSLVKLFQRLSQGDIQVLAELYDELAPKIYGLAFWRTGSNEDASDVVQEVFVKLAARAPSLGAVRRPLSYVLRIAHHESINLLRKRKRECHMEENPLLVSNSDRYADYAVRLSMLIRELPEEQREVIYLRHFLGLSLREISSATGANLFTTASRCRLAIRKLKARLGEGK